MEPSTSALTPYNDLTTILVTPALSHSRTMYGNRLTASYLEEQRCHGALVRNPIYRIMQQMADGAEAPCMHARPNP